jgi:WD repeat-containing protein 61
MFFNTVHEWTAHTEGASSVAFHPSRAALISGGKDAHLTVWDLRNDTLSIHPVHTCSQFAIYSMAFSEKGDRMATSSRDKTWKVWDAATLEVVERIDVKNGGHSHSVNKVIRWCERWITCGDDRQVAVWTE